MPMKRSKGWGIKRLLMVAVVLACVHLLYSAQPGLWFHRPAAEGPTVGNGNSDAVIAEAFANHASNVQVSGRGVVMKVLPDDDAGDRHQRFILRLGSGQTLLVAHNIDLAPKIVGLRLGDAIRFCGEYEWNEKGGLLHWTHRDPQGRHPAGWLDHRGRIYQ